MNELQKFHLYLWYNYCNLQQQEQICDYYAEIITADEVEQIQAMSIAELHTKVKYDGFERPIYDFDFRDLIEQFINRDLTPNTLEKDIASLFSSIEYMKLYEDFKEWRVKAVLPPLPIINSQVSILLPNYCCLVITPRTSDLYTVFILPCIDLMDSKRLDKIERKLKLLLDNKQEITFGHLENIYQTLFYI